MKSRKMNLCGLVFGLLLTLIFGIAYVKVCYLNTKKIRESGNQLYHQISQITKDLQDVSDRIQSINVPGQKVPQSASGGDELVVADVINDSKAHEIAFNKKAHSLYSDVMESTVMSKPAPMYVMMFVIAVVFGFYYYQGYIKKEKYIALFGYIITIFCGCFLVFLLGDLVDDMYLFKELCNVVVTKDTKLQTHDMKAIKTAMSSIAEYHMEKYLHCYNFEFNEMIRTQVINMDVAQLALLKASKIELSQLSDSLATLSHIDKNPKSIPVLIANKGNYQKLPAEQHFTNRYIKKIEAIQDAKKKLVLIPDCVVFAPYFETLMQDVCLDAIDYGLDLYWLGIIVFAGTILIAWGFLRTEILNKAINDAVSYEPSHLYQRYANDVAKNVDDYIDKE